MSDLNTFNISDAKSDDVQTLRAYVVSLDLETTGLSTTKDTICELGSTIHMFKFEHIGQTLRTVHVDDLTPFQSYCKPSTTMHPDAMRVTGLTECFLSDKPSIKHILECFETHLQNEMQDVDVPRFLVTYNGRRFDLPIMVNEIHRSGINVQQYMRGLKFNAFIDVLLLNKSCIDTSKLMRKTNGSCSFKLGDVYQALLKTKLNGAHGAICDSKAVIDILQSDECKHHFFNLVIDNRPSLTRQKCMFNLLKETHDIITNINNRTQNTIQPCKKRTVSYLLNVIKRQKTSDPAKSTL